MRLTAFLVAAMFIVPFVFSQSKQVDIRKSHLVWTGKKVTGEHTGNINFKSGKLIFNGEELTGGEFFVDMTTITCTDIKDKEHNGKLVGHLKSDDFFGVANFKESHLILISVKKTGKGQYLVKGSLKIKGKTNPVEFEVVHAGGKYIGKMVVDRTVYDVRYGSRKFFDNLGDKMIYDNFELEFDVVVF
ncbi:YceI family protein [Marinilabiliaceae bacterium JC017]|nr:YceI family protein [Marinilabiliaceae bacterium JC017]